MQQACTTTGFLGFNQLAMLVDPQAAHDEYGWPEESVKLLSSDSAVTANLLDFAGQEEYYTTHSFFIDRDSVFVVMFNGEEWCRAHSADGTEASEDKVDEASILR